MIRNGYTRPFPTTIIQWGLQLLKLDWKVLLGQSIFGKAFPPFSSWPRSCPVVHFSTDRNPTRAALADPTSFMP